MSKYIMEFIGAFFLILVVALTGNPLAIGGVLAVMVYMGGYISGGHYNPAVTLAVWVRGKIKSQEVLPYFISQVLGGFIGAVVYYILTKNYFVPKPNVFSDVLSVVLTEIIFTFALAFVVLNVATAKKTEGNQYYGLAIGIILMVGAFAGGPISGGVYNPAVALGPILFDFSHLSQNLNNLLIYLIVPSVGGLLAGKVFKTLQFD